MSGECSMGAGCDEAGACYAEANGQPEQCGRRPITENKTWYLGTLNDGLYIINAPPRPSTDDVWHDRPDGPTMSICVSGLDVARAQQIVNAHNLSLQPST